MKSGAAMPGISFLLRFIRDGAIVSGKLNGGDAG